MEEVNLKPIDVEAFTMEDQELFEETTGMIWEAAFTLPTLKDAYGKDIRDEKNRPVKASMPPAKVMSTLIWLNQRKHDESFTLADAKKVRPAKIEWEESDSPEA